MASGSFYSNSQTEVVVDPFVPPSTQSQSRLQSELKRCEQLVQRDYRYAQLVAGAAKMPMPSIWAARNQDELVNDRDLATFKDISWAEFVKKRFLPTVPAGESVATAATSMLEIVREMNLQRRKFQIMGLHEQVEACEIQLIMHLCQASLIRAQANDFKRTALRMRRSQKLHEAFAIAVGACVCASAPMTMGSGVTRYERDLQMEYKKHTIGLLVFVLQKNPGAIDEEEGLDEDYVARIARLIVLWQGNGSGRQQVGEGRSDDGGTVSSDYKESVKQHFIGLTNALGIAQRDAEKAKNDVVELKANAGRENERVLSEVNRKLSEFNNKLQMMGTDLNAKFTQGMAQQQQEFSRMLRDYFVSGGAGAESQQAARTEMMRSLTDDFHKQMHDSIPKQVERVVKDAKIDEKVVDAIHALKLVDVMKREVADVVRGENIAGLVAQELRAADLAKKVQDELAKINMDNLVLAAIARANLDKKVRDAVDVVDVSGKIQDAMRSQETRNLISSVAATAAVGVDIRDMVRTQVTALDVNGEAAREARKILNEAREGLNQQLQAAIAQVNARTATLGEISANAAAAVQAVNTVQQQVAGDGVSIGLAQRLAGVEQQVNGSGTAPGLTQRVAGVEQQINGNGTTPGLTQHLAGMQLRVVGNGTTEMGLEGKYAMLEKEVKDNKLEFEKYEENNDKATDGARKSTEQQIEDFHKRLAQVESARPQSAKRGRSDDDGAAAGPAVGDAEVLQEIRRQVTAKLQAVDATQAFAARLKEDDVTRIITDILRQFDYKTWMTSLPVPVADIDAAVDKYVSSILNSDTFKAGVHQYLDGLSNPPDDPNFRAFGTTPVPDNMAFGPPGP
jgi:hypothetical protein